MDTHGSDKTASSLKRYRRWTAAVAALAIAWPLLASTPARAATDLTMVTVDSSPGEPIFHGQALVFTPDNATFEVFDWGGSAFEMGASNADHSFRARVGAPNGQVLAPGTYPTTRMGSDESAQLDVSGDGLGCNTSTGTLTVHEISFQSDPVVEVLTFAATYEQTCDDFTEPLYGELRFHSSVDVIAAVSDPGSFDFGQRLVGTTSSEKVVTVANGGTLDLSLGAASVSGPAAGDFTLTSDTCSGVTLAPAESCAVGATFTPSDTGARSAVVHLDATTASGARDIGLSGTGTKFNTAVKLQLSDASITFGERIRITARMTKFDPSVDQRLNIYAKPYGGTYSLLSSKVVNDEGVISTTHTPKKETSYVAKFLGDEHYYPARTFAKTVTVRVIIRGTLLHVDGRSGTYALYDYTSSCPNDGKGCPTYAVTVTPNHEGKWVCFQLQLRVSGSWQTAISCFQLRLSGRSKATAVFVYRNRKVIGIPTRVRATFFGDADHLRATTPWAYFKVRA